MLEGGYNFSDGKRTDRYAGRDESPYDDVSDVSPKRKRFGIGFKIVLGVFVCILVAGGVVLYRTFVLVSAEASETVSLKGLKDGRSDSHVVTSGAVEADEYQAGNEVSDENVKKDSVKRLIFSDETADIKLSADKKTISVNVSMTVKNASNIAVYSSDFPKFVVDKYVSAELEVPSDKFSPKDVMKCTYSILCDTNNDSFSFFPLADVHCEGLSEISDMVNEKFEPVKAEAEKAAADALAKAEAKRLADEAKKEADEKERKEQEAAAREAARVSAEEESRLQSLAASAPTSSVRVQSSADIDSWAARIDNYLAGHTLAGYGRVFAETAYKYGVDPRISPAISMIESGGGDVCFRPHNAWGWGSSSWSSWEEAIEGHISGLLAGYGPDFGLDQANVYSGGNGEYYMSYFTPQVESI